MFYMQLLLKAFIAFSSASLLCAIFCLYKGIYALINYISWNKKSKHLTGKVIEKGTQKGIPISKSNVGTHKVYYVKLDNNREPNSDDSIIKILESVNKFQAFSIKEFDIDDNIDLLYREDIYKYKSILGLRGACMYYLYCFLTCLVCCALPFIILVIIGYIGSNMG